MYEKSGDRSARARGLMGHRAVVDATRRPATYGPASGAWLWRCVLTVAEAEGR